MVTLKNIALPFAMAVSLTAMACGGGGQTAVGNAPASAPAVLSLPDVPSTLTEPEARLAYVLDHYWDNMPWGDSAACADTVFVEQSMVDFLDLLSHADSSSVAAAYTKFLRVLPDGMTGWLTDMACEYLFSPDSPVYSQDVFSTVAGVMLTDGRLEDYKREVLVDRRASALKNRRGSRAADFVFVGRDGRRSRLSDVVRKAGKTLLLFYDPDCDRCKALEEAMASSPGLGEAIANGSVSVVAVDPMANSTDMWRGHAATLPPEWTVGYSPGGEIDDRELYMLPALPSVYVIDRDMTVLIRDADNRQISHILD